MKPVVTMGLVTFVNASRRQVRCAFSLEARLSVTSRIAGPSPRQRCYHQASVASFSDNNNNSTGGWPNHAGQPSPMTVRKVAFPRWNQTWQSRRHSVASFSTTTSVDEGDSPPTPDPRSDEERFRERDRAAWSEKYEELLKYKEEHGHCNVRLVRKDDSEEEEEEWVALAHWVHRQRTTLRSNNMSAERYALLEKVDFNWDFREDTWEESYKKMKEYKELNLHCLVPQRHGGLGKWVQHQRAHKSNRDYNRANPTKPKKKPEISDERVEKLDELDFCWDVLEASWHEQYEELIEYLKENPNFPTPAGARKDEGTKRIYNWVQYQKKLKAKLEDARKKLEKDPEYHVRTSLTPEKMQYRIKLLDQLKFPWPTPRRKKSKEE